MVTETLKDDLRRVADLERILYEKERETFLQRVGRTGSEHTRTTCRSALDRLDEWCKRQGISILELTPARADDWIESLKAEGQAPSNIALMVAAALSFWTWSERRNVELRNPFRGTRSRPAKKARRTLEVPTDAEVRLIEQAADGWLWAAIALISQTGLSLRSLFTALIAHQIDDAFRCLTKKVHMAGQIAARKGALLLPE
ncbi:MAG: site-specific integrase [Spirochaetia bacterium]